MCKQSLGRAWIACHSVSRLSKKGLTVDDQVSKVVTVLSAGSLCVEERVLISAVQCEFQQQEQGSCLRSCTAVQIAQLLSCAMTTPSSMVSAVTTYNNTHEHEQQHDV